MNQIVKISPDVINTYTSEDKALWRELHQRVRPLRGNLCPEFSQGLTALKIGKRIPRIEEVSARLFDISGWRLRPVPGMITTETGCFELLVDRIYPVCWAMRRPEEIDFAQGPDWWHDSHHTGMLTNRYVGSFLQRLGKAGIQANSSEARAKIWRIYSTTLETGLIGKRRPKIFGAACASSVIEAERCLSPGNQVPFNRKMIEETIYDDQKPQGHYYVLEDFEQLLDLYPPYS